MDTADRIKTIVETIAIVAQDHPACAMAAGFASRAIAASSGRAALSEPRLSSSARMSVAASAMSFVAQVVDSGRVPSIINEKLAGIVRNAASLAPLTVPDHANDTAAFPSPAGWSGPEGGPYCKNSSDGAIMTISRRPHLPGGDWTLHYAGVPASFGDTPDVAATRSSGFDAIFSNPEVRRQLPPLPLRYPHSKPQPS